MSDNRLVKLEEEFDAMEREIDVLIERHVEALVVNTNLEAENQELRQIVGSLFCWSEDRVVMSSTNAALAQAIEKAAKYI